MRKNDEYRVRWMNLHKRVSAKYVAEHPSYSNVTICDEWYDFDCFKEWMMKQDWEGKELDKDLLSESKVYSPETCVFIPREINTFMTIRENERGVYPLGVSITKQGRYAARINKFGKPIRVGTYDTSEEAHNQYLKHKVLHCKQLMNKYSSNTLIVKGLKRIGNILLKHYLDKTNFECFCQ